MIPEQQNLLMQARDSLAAARLLDGQGYLWICRLTRLLQHVLRC